MFVIDLLISKNSDEATAEIELLCPTREEADAAEESLFYGAEAPQNMLFVRVTPTMIRMNFIEPAWVTKELFEIGLRPEEALIHRDTLAAQLPSFASLDYLQFQHNAVMATASFGVSTFGELEACARSLVS